VSDRGIEVLQKVLFKRVSTGRFWSVIPRRASSGAVFSWNSSWISPDISRSSDARNSYRVSPSRAYPLAEAGLERPLEHTPYGAEALADVEHRRIASRLRPRRRAVEDIDLPEDVVDLGFAVCPVDHAVDFVDDDEAGV
jgi:hypothetical protein